MQFYCMSIARCLCFIFLFYYFLHLLPNKDGHYLDISVGARVWVRGKYGGRCPAGAKVLDPV